MLTPQEVSSKTFPKAVMGGYNMVSVDEFLDKLTEDYSSLYKDNVALKAKIKLLAEKMDESRQTEESFRSLLLSAQKMATEIVTSAESKRDAIVQEAEAHRSTVMGDAEKDAKARMAELKRLVEAEEQRLLDKRQEVDAAIAAEEYRLERARTAVGKFMELARSSCEEQLQILDKLTEMLPPPPQRPAEPVQAAAPIRAPEPPPEPAEPVQETRVVSLIPEEPVEELEEEPVDEPTGDLEPLEDDEEYYEEEHRGGLLKNLFRRGRDYEDEYEDEEEEERPRSSAPSRAAPSTDDFDDADTRVIALDDLQFGRNYNKEK